jgi:zinc transport system ATP-binding protein
MPLNGDPPALSLRKVAVGYDDAAIVHDVDLTVAAGDVFALIGANGSGKSTLVKGILGLAQVISGELELFGVPAARFRDRARIGYVPQRHTVGGPVPATVHEVVASGRLPRRRVLSRPSAGDRAAVARAIAVVGLTERSGSSVNELSGGQQRRVLIARALAAEPDLLIMDEPTAGVDAVSQAALGQTLTRLADERVPMIIVTHDLLHLAPVVTSFLLMSEGRVIYQGGLDALADHDPHLHAALHHRRVSDDADRPSLMPDLALGG